MSTTFDAEAAAQHAVDSAQPTSTGKCAHYVRLAIAAGGINLTSVPLAKNYGPSLEAGGFSSLLVTTQGQGPSGYNPQIGDVVVIQAATGHPDGHMEIFTHRGFVSDFIQKDPFWPSSSPTSIWHVEKPSSQVFRFPRNGSNGQENELGPTNEIDLSGDFFLNGPIIEGSTYCPVSKWAQAMGFQIDLDTDAKTVSFDGQPLGTPVTILSDGEAYVPIRVLADAAGLNVAFDPATHKVNVTQPS